MVISLNRGQAINLRKQKKRTVFDESEDLPETMKMPKPKLYTGPAIDETENFLPIPFPFPRPIDSD